MVITRRASKRANPDDEVDGAKPAAPVAKRAKAATGSSTKPQTVAKSKPVPKGNSPKKSAPVKAPRVIAPPVITAASESTVAKEAKEKKEVEKGNPKENGKQASAKKDAPQTKDATTAVAAGQSIVAVKHIPLEGNNGEGEEEDEEFSEDEQVPEAQRRLDECDFMLGRMAGGSLKDVARSLDKWLGIHCSGTNRDMADYILAFLEMKMKDGSDLKKEKRKVQCFAGGCGAFSDNGSDSEGFDSEDDY
ncbi:hypothetical protein HGRIS_010888 [Hohenbuehelia grisea]|uniref:Uncharacterized protein n=1 Tax=Hohenbuehelia grisea TaxID=104357 RepID=A0ABR3IYY0_9AGAR